MRKDTKKTAKERFGDFMSGKGFYIALFLCAAAIGISGYFLFTESKRAAETAGKVEIVVTPTPTPTPTAAPGDGLPAVTARPTTAPEPTPTPTAAATPAPTPTPTPTATPTPAATPEPAPKPVVFTWPLRGEILSDHSLEVLAYDETMGDWRTHSGVDIGGSLGTSVLAAGDGTVTDVYADPLMGTTVIIDHGEGHTSMYCNLEAKPPVAAGDTVTTGMVIGAVGATAPAERARPSHLHFEMTEGGRSVDPVTVLPKLY